jgi:hypothetical protein
LNRVLTHNNNVRVKCCTGPHLKAGDAVTLAVTPVDADGIPLRSLPAGTTVTLAAVPPLGASSCAPNAAAAGQFVCAYTPVSQGRAALTVSVGGVAGPVLRPIVVAAVVDAASSRYSVRQAGLIGLDMAPATAEKAVAAAASGDSVAILNPKP